MSGIEQKHQQAMNLCAAQIEHQCAVIRALKRKHIDVHKAEYRLMLLVETLAMLQDRCRPTLLTAKP